ncbi:MAG: NAD+ synthase [Pseudomonadota bacterium]
MKVTLAQLNPKVGDFQGNLAKALAVLERVKPDLPDLIIFSELFLMGYPPQDLLEKKWFIERQRQALDVLIKESKNHPDTGLVVGAAVPTNRPHGHGLYNAALLIHQGQAGFSQAKTLLPVYDVFDEARYFDTAAQIKPVPFKGEVLGLTVCEDAWNDPDMWQSRLYTQDPIEAMAQKRPSLLINVSASPFHAGKDETRYRLLSNHAARHQIPFIFVNQVGGDDQLIFDGQSMILDKKGRPLVMLDNFVEQVVTVDLDKPGPPLTFVPQDRAAAVRQALVLGIRDYLGKSGFSSAVVGLSGGIDSAVTCALAVEALGPANVAGISMPSVFSSQGSKDDAAKLARNLGVNFQTIPIKSIHDAYLKSLAPHFKGREPDVTEENIQARIRGNLLMAFSNKFGSLVLSTGNKSELAMGYCTLYGDMSGGLAVLSDVPKAMVYQLAELINQNGEIIPRESIEKPPSAELRPNQKDEDSLPPYPLLEQILQLHIEEGLSSREIIAKGFEPDMVSWIVRTVNRNEYKRRQAPPGLKVTTKAFGVGRRMPIVAEHNL